MLHLYAALAERERRLISKQTKAALAARKVTGGAARQSRNIAQAGKLGHQWAPNLKAYVDRVTARPKVREALKAEGLS